MGGTVTKNRVGRNDRLGSAEERKREKVAKDRVGRNDRLGNSSGGEAKTREVKTSAEAATDPVGQKNRPSLGCG